MKGTESTVQIIPFYAHPHVFTKIIDNTWYDETVAIPADPNDLPYATAVVTGADRGIDNTFVRVNDIRVKNSIFGKANFRKYGQPSLQADTLFNGQTNVWFCRVLPDNATYSNLILLAHYRKGKIRDELDQETGMSRLEVKFSFASAAKPSLTKGALTDEEIDAYAQSLTSNTVDPATGYMTVPLCYIRSVGRGKYGNNYSMSFERDLEAEKEFNLKMYKFNLIDNETVTRVANVFSGSLYQTTAYDMSTLIGDVIDQFSTGSCPVFIKSYEGNLEKIYDFYKDTVVASNLVYCQTDKDLLEEWEYANGIDISGFDPLFGIRLLDRNEDTIPYYKNYTVKDSGPYIEPDYTVPDVAGKFRPLSTVGTNGWSTAFVGAKCLVMSDALKQNRRWLYTVVAIDDETSTIVYDEGVEVEIDADQYSGANIKINAGHMLTGGHDGDFQEITVDTITRAPNEAEMKILLAREQVKAFRGEKDRNILSPARINIDFLFDANYNLTSALFKIDTITAPLYNNSTVLTDSDQQQLVILSGNAPSIEFNDIDVKRAMYDLNEFRNRNGMTINMEQGAGCILYLDCNVTGLKKVDVNYELLDLINTMDQFDGRQTVIDLGYYEIFDPITGRRIKVTTSYFIASNIIPHLMHYGLNKPFVYNYATLQSYQRDSSLIASGNMIRDSFKPDIDLIDWDVKELLYKSRINYYLTGHEGRTVQRACQNTRQREASALLEENNVRVLNTLKKQLEKACRGYLYEWNNPEVRKGYTDAQMKNYEPWIGDIVESLDIRFDANEFEQERMMMHCYVIVKFHDIVKRIILEINVERPDYNTGGAN